MNSLDECEKLIYSIVISVVLMASRTVKGFLADFSILTQNENENDDKCGKRTHVDFQN